MTPEPAAVALDGVDKTFPAAGGGAVHALAEIELRLAPGEFVSLIGPSGCGKSTLLRVVADLEQPSAGTVLVGGKTARQARLDQDYGIAFQQAGLLEWRTVAENVEPGPRSCWSWSASPTSPRTGPASSPAGCSSASPSRGRSRPARRCCSWTSRSARWTR
jgi:ABC-type sugar transport system ATPase subunit